MGRSLVTAGRIVMMRSIGYRCNENKLKIGTSCGTQKYLPYDLNGDLSKQQPIGIFVVCLLMSSRFRVRSKILLMLDALPSLAGLLKR